MTRWAGSVQRDQLVLFTESLDKAIPAEHTVRILDEILGQLDWSDWEAAYHDRLGQPAIHPRILAGVLLYGLLTRVRSSRSLEEALNVRLDFRWLASDRRIDHTTLSEFRRNHPTELKDLFTRICQIAREMGFLNLQRLGYDGTRVRANNRRSGTRTVSELQQERDELAAKFESLTSQAEAEDARDDEFFESGGAHALPRDLRSQQARLAKLDATLRTLAQVDQEGGTVPKRVPTTDLEARLMPNKEGGFAPNYTPTATVDIDSGLIVGADVLNDINEDGQLVPSIVEVRNQFGISSTESITAMADGLNGTAANLAACVAENINLISPCEIPDAATNPALRADPTQPVSPADWNRLPIHTINRQDKQTQLDKNAFVYDEERDCYWCPMGQPLKKFKKTSEQNAHGRRTRFRYQAEPAACEGCPLRDRCLSNQAKSRQISREENEKYREDHARKMATQEAQDLYKLRRHPGERPFAIIKQQFGMRQFLLRGLDRIKTEWQWAVTAFNLHRLISMLRIRAGPEPACH